MRVMIMINTLYKKRGDKDFSKSAKDLVRVGETREGGAIFHMHYKVEQIACGTYGQFYRNRRA